jgi:hypothetical protein
MIVRQKSRGRPRKAGARHPSGQLVRKTEPNAKVVEIRRALAGQGVRPETAEDPMSLALARGWISAGQHEAGAAYAALWRRSHPQRRAPGFEETPEPAQRDLRRVSEMSDVEITAAFEAILAAGERAGPPSEASQAEARRRYNEMSRALTPGEQNEVFLCFCLGSCPQWILQRCAGRFQTDWERKHRLLVAGLERLAGLRRPRRTALAL